VAVGRVRIFHKSSGREAAPRNGAYHCFPPGDNTTALGKRFHSVEAAALFLLRKPEWKVWVAPNLGHKDGQVSKEIVIEGAFDRDELKRKSLIP